MGFAKARKKFPQRVLYFLVRAALGLGFVADELQQRVALLRRFQIEHQTVLVGGNGRQRKNFGFDRLFEVQHQAHDFGLVLSDAQAGDVRVVGPDLADQFAQRRAQLQAIDINHQTGRVLGDKMFGRQSHITFQRDAGVVQGRPQTHRHDAGTEGEISRSECQHQAAHAAQGLAPGWIGLGLFHGNSACPVVE